MLGLLPVIYVIPLAYLGVLLQRRVFERMGSTGALAAAFALFLVAKYAQMRMELKNEIGFAAVSDYTNLAGLFLNHLEAVTGVLMLFQVCRFAISRFSDIWRKYSLHLHLFHAFIALFIYELLLKLMPEWSVLLLFIVSMAATVVLSMAAGRFIAEHTLLTRLLFPRNTGELLGRHSGSDASAAMLNKDMLYKKMPKGNDIT